MLLSITTSRLGESHATIGCCVAVLKGVMVVENKCRPGTSADS